MKEFSHREFWILVMTIMHTSQRAQSLAKEQRVAIEEAIRAKHCPDISYQEWEEIGIDANSLKTLNDSFRHIVDHVNIADLRELVQQSHTPQSPEILDLIDEIEK